MKLTKNHWMIIGAIVVIAIAYFMFFKKKKAPLAALPVVVDPKLARSTEEAGYDIVPGVKGWEMPRNAMR